MNNNNIKKSESGCFSLNFGNTCQVFQRVLSDRMRDADCLNERREEKKYSQNKIVELLLGLMYTDVEIGKVEDFMIKYALKDISNLFNNKRRLSREVCQYAQQNITDIIKKNIENRILKQLNDTQKEMLLVEMKKLVEKLPKDKDYMGLRDYLGITFQTEEENRFFSSFLAKCIRFSLLMPNTPGERVKWSRINECPNVSRKDDPYRLVSNDQGSKAVIIQLIDHSGYSQMKTFHNFEAVVSTILQRNLIINNVEFLNGQIHVYYDRFSKQGYKLRMLKKKDFAGAREFVEKYEFEFCRKRCWGDNRLSNMVFIGLTSEIWTAYGYYSPENHLISYLDVKERIDGGIELGVMLTDKAYRGMYLATSLVFFFRLMFAYCRLFGGTYYKNFAMKRTFHCAGFSRIQYYDHNTGQKTHMIKERVNPEHPEDEEFDEYSVYYFAESVINKAYTSRVLE